MTILFDTNVILDVLQKREPFFSDSYKALRKAIEAESDCMLSATAVTDIFYIIRKVTQSPEQAKQYIEKLSQMITFADVQGVDIHTALTRSMPDFEDAVVDAVAERNGSDYIVTRNTQDFMDSAVPAITPVDFLQK